MEPWNCVRKKIKWREKKQVELVSDARPSLYLLWHWTLLPNNQQVSTSPAGHRRTLLAQLISPRCKLNILVNLFVLYLPTFIEVFFFFSLVCRRSQCRSIQYFTLLGIQRLHGLVSNLFIFMTNYSDIKVSVKQKLVL